MSDLISRQAAIDAVKTYLKDCQVEDADWHGNGIEYELESLPSAHPKRKIGKWQITDAYPHNVYCSECHKRFAQTHWVVWEDGSLPRNYCPNCGADMRGEQDG